MTAARPHRSIAAGVLLLAALAGAAPARAAGETAPCAECGMTALVAGRYTVRLGEGPGAAWFCDIGDFAAYLDRVKPKAFAASVHDFAAGAWVDARKAAFVRDKAKYQTPMGWGIAAFADPRAAAAAGKPLDLEALRASLRTP